MIKARGIPLSSVDQIGLVKCAALSRVKHLASEWKTVGFALA